jgi:hypothetical protein
MSVGFGFSLPATAPYGGGGNNPFGQLGPTLDLSFVDGATGVTDVSNPTGYTLSTDFITPQYQIAAQYAIWEAGVGLSQKTFSQIVTFARASTATYFNSAGVLTSAGNNVARFDYNPSTLAPQGLLIEEGRTNILLRSAEFATSPWLANGAIGTAVTADQTTSPDGTVNADKLTEGTSSGAYWVNQQQTIVANTQYTFSAFVKAAGRNYAGIAFGKSGTPFTRGGLIIDLTTGARTLDYSSNSPTSVVRFDAVNVGNGWWRVAVSVLIDATSTDGYAEIFPSDNGTNRSYTGNGVDGIYVYGAQLESGQFPTSYIPTTAATVTRAADDATISTLSPWFNSAQGTFYTEAVGVNNVAGATRRFFEIGDAGINNRMLAGYSSTTNTRFLVVNGGVTQADIAITTGVSAGSLVKMSSAYEIDAFRQASNGSLGGDSSGSVPVVTAVYLGKDSTAAASVVLNGYLRRITYYPRRLSNTDLQAITV